MFSVRYVVHDYYLSKPTSFINENTPYLKQPIVRYPVIRIYGSSPHNQRCCLNIHGVFPYFFCSLPLIDSSTEISTFLTFFAHSLESSISSSFNSLKYSNTKPPFIYNIELVSATPFYGFSPSSSHFLKLSFIYPHISSVAADLLRSGQVCNTSFTLYEAHLSYLSQFMIDYSLVGMDYVHVESPFFRVPLPDCGEKSTEVLIDFNRPIFQSDADDGIVQISSLLRTSKSSIELDVVNTNIKNTLKLFNNSNVSSVPTLTSIKDNLNLIRKELNIPNKEKAQVPDFDSSNISFLGFASREVLDEMIGKLIDWYGDVSDDSLIENDAPSNCFLDELSKVGDESDDDDQSDSPINQNDEEILIVDSDGEFPVSFTAEEAASILASQEDLESFQSNFQSNSEEDEVMIGDYSNINVLEYAHKPPSVLEILISQEKSRGKRSVTIRENNVSTIGINSSVYQQPSLVNQVLPAMTSSATSSAHKSRQQLSVRFNLTVLCIEVLDYPTNQDVGQILAVSWSFWSDLGEDISTPQSIGVVYVNQSPINQDLTVTISTTRLKPTCTLSPSVVKVYSEGMLFRYLVELIIHKDPDILLGWDSKRQSLGKLSVRAQAVGIDFLNEIARNPSPTRADVNLVPSTHAPWGSSFSELKVQGRLVLSVWRVCTTELRLRRYTFESVLSALFKISLPKPSAKCIVDLCSRVHRSSDLISLLLDRAYFVLKIILHLDVLSKTAELSRVFGIDFFSVLSRGSQYRVESLLFRMTKVNNYILYSPTRQQVFNQRAPECIALVMEPWSGIYRDPVIVLDFQSLYPSIMIAFNYCFSTCLGKMSHPHNPSLGCGGYHSSAKLINRYLVNDKLVIAPNGVLYVDKSICLGTLPTMLNEILQSRILIKKLIKDIKSNESLSSSCEIKRLLKQLDARQFALKMISNTTYGYTSAGFSGRMPCVELADSIVQTGRELLEFAVDFVESTVQNCSVVYGDTDSLFIRLNDRSLEEAFDIGLNIVKDLNKLLPSPLELQMEKVFMPCMLFTKKRYCGIKYTSPSSIGVLESKGIETIRRDSCPLVSKVLTSSLEILFRSNDVSAVKAHVVDVFRRVLAQRINISDFIFCNEVRPFNSYSAPPPGAILAQKTANSNELLGWQSSKHTAFAERVPFVIIAGPSRALLKDLVMSPRKFAKNPALRLNSYYYITRQLIPVLNRALRYVNIDTNRWWNETPRTISWDYLDNFCASFCSSANSIHFSIGSIGCVICGSEVASSAHFNAPRCLPFEALCTTCLRRRERTCLILGNRLAIESKQCCFLNKCCVIDIESCDNIDCHHFFTRSKAIMSRHSVRQLNSILSSFDDFC
ncbi:hypothetical protein P9112_014199 [Eukaryota sp. TZLM1-RC]